MCEAMACQSEAPNTGPVPKEQALLGLSRAWMSVESGGQALAVVEITANRANDCRFIRLLAGFSTWIWLFFSADVQARATNCTLHCMKQESPLEVPVQ